MKPDQDRIMNTLHELVPVELMLFQWYLSKGVFKDFPPIPQKWLKFANTSSTMKAMVKCYGDAGAARITVKILRKMERDCPDIELHSPFPQNTDPPASKSKAAPKPVPDFPRRFRRKLVNRMQHTEAVLDALQKHSVLSKAEREAVSVYTLQDKNKALVDMVLRKGNEASERFYEALREAEPYLVEELEGQRSLAKEGLSGPISEEPPMLPVLRCLLEGLVSDELKTFQWYLTQHVKEGCPPIRKSQLHKASMQQMERLMERHYGRECAMAIALTILKKIILIPSVEGKETWLSAVTVESGGRESTSKLLDPDMPVILITPEVHKDGNMFRLQCPHAGVFQCSVTGLLLVGEGEVTYWTLPWYKPFLSGKGKRPAGPLFKFTCLKGSFSQLHLPHCERLPEGLCDVLSVVHVTDDKVEFIRPTRTTDTHVVVNITGFSAFGLVKADVPSTSASPIDGMVLLFHKPSNDPDLYSSLYMLLLPRNALIPQVTKEWEKRIGAEYIEALPDCELIPNEMYQLSGTPAQLIQPEVARFLNFENYDNYTASFEVHLEKDSKTVELALRHSRRRQYQWPLPSWLFGQDVSVVWRRVIKLNATPPSDNRTEKIRMTDQLLNTLNGLTSEELHAFQQHLTHCANPIPICHLEDADRVKTVDRMVQKFRPAGAKDIMVDILRKMDNNNLADDLQRC